MDRIINKYNIHHSLIFPMLLAPFAIYPPLLLIHHQSVGARRSAELLQQMFNEIYLLFHYSHNTHISPPCILLPLKFSPYSAIASSSSSGSYTNWGLMLVQLIELRLIL